MQTARSVGPIPQGDYTVGVPRHSNHVGAYTMSLSPDTGPQTFSRDAFYMHGDGTAPWKRLRRMHRYGSHHMGKSLVKWRQAANGGAMKPFAALLMMFAPAAVLGADPLASPAQISAAIDREGASAFFRSLDDPATEKLFDNIGSGRGGWVALAPKLAKGADGANGEGLGIALAYALPCKAAAVLKVVDPLEDDSHILAVSCVCGIPFIENTPKDYNAKAMLAVSTVSTGNLRIKARCLSVLCKS